jgi:hypothetical protein
VVGGNASTGSVTLSAAAPIGGATVALTSDSPATSVPASLTIPAGVTSAGFTVATRPVGVASTATISAAYAGNARTAALVLNSAPGLATLLVSASGRTGESISSSPAGINVAVGNIQSAGFALNTSITLTASNGRSVVWSGACSSAGKKVPSCQFVLTGDASVDGNIQ